jgi:hypothetical protein
MRIVAVAFDANDSHSVAICILLKIKTIRVDCVLGSSCSDRRIIYAVSFTKPQLAILCGICHSDMNLYCLQVLRVG